MCTFNHLRAHQCRSAPSFFKHAKKKIPRLRPEAWVFVLVKSSDNARELFHTEIVIYHTQIVNISSNVYTPIKILNHPGRVVQSWVRATFCHSHSTKRFYLPTSVYLNKINNVYNFTYLNYSVTNSRVQQSETT